MSAFSPQTEYEDFVRSLLWLCERLSASGFPVRALDELRRMPVGGPYPALLWELVGRSESARSFSLDDALVRPWALGALGAALMSRPLVSAHDPRVSLGLGLSGLVSELSLSLILAERSGFSFERAFLGAVSALGSAGVRVDWGEVGALIYGSVSGAPQFGTLADKVTSDYYRALLRRSR